MALVRMPAILLALVAVLALAACGGDSNAGGTTDNPDDLVVNTQEEGGPDWVKSEDDPAPGQAVERFVKASIDRDYRTMWDSFSKATQVRVAPSFAEFKGDLGRDFATSVGGFVPGKYEVVNSARTGPALAVASVAGERIDPASKKKEYETFGSALVKEGDDWKLELFSHVQETLVIPEERIAQKIPRVAVAAEAGAPILEVGVWIDGKQYPSPTEGASPTQMTIFAEPDEEFEPGNHTVQVLASVGDTATATSWTFIVAD